MPQYLLELLHIYSPNRPLRNSNSNTILLNVPRTSKSIGDRAFSVIGPRFWNDLPADIRKCPTENCFKHKIKSYLMSIQ